MGNYKPYLKYKNSNIPWLGEIPEHWEVRKLKYLSEITTGNKDTIDQLESGQYPFYVRSKSVKRINTFSFDGEAILTAGDGEICKIWHYVNGKFDFHQRVYKIYNFKDVDGKFLYYHLLENFQYDVLKLSAKSTVDSLRRPMFTNFYVGFPTSKKEQTAIARFLDYKLAKINRFIQKKKQLIKLLNEQKAAIINQAVTKGLDANVKMKDSGIEWLEDIPEHWEVRKLKYLGNFQNGISAGAEYFGSGYPFISYGDVYKNFELPELASSLANSTENERVHYSVKQGDILFTRTSETIEEIGFSSTCLKSIENATFSGFLIRFRPFEGKLFDGFSKYYFRSSLHRRFFVKEMNLVTRASLSQELLKRMPVLLPPLEEQVAIAKYIDGETATINTTISKIETELALTEEYKTALIAEAVTGKIDVRGYEVPEVTEEETYEEIEEEISMAAEEQETYEIE